MREEIAKPIPRISLQHHEIIIQTLRELSQRNQEFTRGFTIQEPRFLHALDLAKGQLYFQFSWIASIAEEPLEHSFIEEERHQFFLTVQHLYRIMFSGLYPDQDPTIFLIPEKFYSTKLSIMLTQARIRIGEGLISVNEVVSSLQLNRDTIYNLMYKGELHPWKIKNRLQFEEWEVEMVKSRRSHQSAVL